MDISLLKADIERIATDLFNKKTEEAAKSEISAILTTTSQTIDTLTDKTKSLASEVDEKQKAIDELTSSLEQTKQELASKTKEVESFSAEKEELAKTVASLTEDKKTLDTKFTEVSMELDAIKLEATVKTRMYELETASILLKDIPSQKEKVTKMSNEEFASYKTELITIKETIEEKMKAGLTTNVPPNRAEAQLNLESDSSDMGTKYRALGSSLAKAWQTTAQV